MNEMSKQYKAAVQERADLIAEGKRLYQAAETAGRELTADEKVRDDAINARLDTLAADIKRHETRRARELGAPAVLKLPRGDNEAGALAHFFRSGDVGGVKSLGEVEQEGRSFALTLPFPNAAEQRRLMQAAAVDSTNNVTTDADGKYAVPIGLVRDIVNRKNESDLWMKLGLRRVPGTGTTVNYPVDGADPEVFAATAEQADNHGTSYERHAGVLGQKAFTLAKKTRKVELTEEILEDNDAGLLDHISDRIGREIAKTHNSMLITEAAASGTKVKDFASATAIAAGEPEAIMFNDALSYYLEDGGSIAWVTRPSTFGAVAALTGNARLYAQTPSGSFQKQLLGYPVEYSQAVTAPAASAKSLYFANWNYVGYREGPELRFIMDPYSVDGLVILKYSFRAVVGVLQAAAVGYGLHPTG